nr:hypothetical protein CFP56_69640 [Quercus suber]
MVQQRRVRAVSPERFNYQSSRRIMIHTFVKMRAVGEQTPAASIYYTVLDNESSTISASYQQDLDRASRTTKQPT